MSQSDRSQSSRWLLKFGQLDEIKCRPRERAFLLASSKDFNLTVRKMAKQSRLLVVAWSCPHYHCGAIIARSVGRSAGQSDGRIDGQTPSVDRARVKISSSVRSEKEEENLTISRAGPARVSSNVSDFGRPTTLKRL